MKRTNHIFSIFIIALLYAAAPASGADESVLFTSVQPDALIVLDLSGSMDWNPAGGNNIWGDASCAGPFFSSSGSGHDTNCSRLAIAKRAIFDVLDDTDNNTINSSGSNTDDTSLSVRLGYMRYYNCSDSSDEPEGTYNYSSGCNRLIKEIGSKYSKVYCDSNNSCSSTASAGSSVSGENASGGTPLAASLHEAKLYLDVHKAGDTAAACRKKFVILITDGADTYHCGGNGQENQADQYKRRKATVANAKALADAGYDVFVVGFGAAMPDYLEKTLNWAAYYGHTDNPLASNSGDTAAITPSADPCNEDAANDPANAPLSGYAFIAGNADELATALKQAIDIIREATYSFSVTSVSSARITSENNLYEASLQPVDDEPFWIGRLKKYNINVDGSLGTVEWDAGEELAERSADDRNMKTYKNGAVVDFKTANIAPRDLGLADADTNRRNEVVGYFRGEAAYNEDNWKLGDIWHSNPVVLTSPSPYYEDRRDVNNAFAAFRNNNQRTSDNGKRAVLVGANDGQFHVFETNTGAETFSFIPPNLLPKLPLIAHKDHPTALQHQYYVDGPISAADVWLGNGDGTSKMESDWRTLAVVAEGRGAGTYLWSASTSCTPDTSLTNNGYSQTYAAGTPNYCGYYALDFTNTLSPSYKWRIAPAAAAAPYLGDPWSKMSLGKVIINGNETWVGFIGGGGYDYSCSGGQPPDPGTRGKGFFVVDLKTGSVLWSYTKLSNALMDYSIPAPPAIVDTDNDGFIDTAYVGDLGGNMWRFRFCNRNHDTTCGAGSWTGGRFFASSTGTIRPIYSGAVITKDSSGSAWIYWGTGDEQCPTDANAQERFFAVKDDPVACTSDSECTGGGICASRRCTYTYNFNDLDNLTSAGQTYGGTKQGWALNLPGSGEKMLAEPTVFGGVVYFTTYTPPSGGGACSQGGTGKLYGVIYTTGGGALDNGDRSMALGTGIPSTPIVSVRPDGTGADLYVTNSGGGGIDAQTVRPPGVTPAFPAHRSKILFWKDRRLQ